MDQVEGYGEKRLQLRLNLPSPVGTNAVAVVSNLDNAHYVRNPSIRAIVYPQQKIVKFQL